MENHRGRGDQSGGGRGGHSGGGRGGQNGRGRGGGHRGGRGWTGLPRGNGGRGNGQRNFENFNYIQETNIFDSNPCMNPNQPQVNPTLYQPWYKEDPLLNAYPKHEDTFLRTRIRGRDFRGEFATEQHPNIQNPHAPDRGSKRKEYKQHVPGGHTNSQSQPNFPTNFNGGYQRPSHSFYTQEARRDEVFTGRSSGREFQQQFNIPVEGFQGLPNSHRSQQAQFWSAGEFVASNSSVEFQERINRQKDRFQNIDPNIPRRQKQSRDRSFSGINPGLQLSETNLYHAQSIESINSNKSLKLNIQDQDPTRVKKNRKMNKNKLHKDATSYISNTDLSASCDSRPLSRSSSCSYGQANELSDQDFVTSPGIIHGNNRTQNIRGRGKGRGKYRGRGSSNFSSDFSKNRDSRPLSRSSSCSNDQCDELGNQGYSMFSDVKHENSQNQNSRGRGKERGNSKKVRHERKGNGNKVENDLGKQKLNITIEQLQKLSQKDPVEVLTVLSEDSKYSAILQEDLDPKMFLLAVDILSKICSTATSQSKAEIMRQISLPTFTNQLFNCITEYPYLEDKDVLQCANYFFENAITLYETLFDFMPSAVRVWYNHLVEVQKSLKTMSKVPNIQLNPDLLKMAKSLIDDIGNHVKKEVKEEKVQARSKEKETYFPEPVGNFRTVSIYPRPEDVYSEQPFLYPNVIEGPYRSVEYYLDIHFKLLREDFMSPIRQAIRDYKKQCNTKDRFKRVDNVRIYRKVKFLHSKTVMDTIGYEVCFDVDDKIHRVNWEFSNRFMYGSLLLFTNDDFDSFFLATVANRNVEELKKKLVTVELVEKLENVKSILGKEFIMAESEAYFNPYFHVLKALQKFDETNFPLKKYIVDVNTETEPPRYLTIAEIYNIRMAQNNFTFRVLSDFEWPNHEQLGLDPSQFRAFKAALTSDLTVIQGPPGTGKTFLGLKIAHGLLANAHVWNHADTPIFVVCFTNHALDQFLEGLLPVTNKLVRIGGKSKGTELDKFNIRERRREYSYYKKVQGRELRDLKLKMSTVFADIKVHQTNLKALDDTIGVLSVQTLQMVMSEEQRDYFSSDDDLIDWLLVGVGAAKTEKKVKITITADRGVVREAPPVDPLTADTEDSRVKQAFFDTIDLDTNVGPSEDTVTIQLACDLSCVEKRHNELLQQLNSRKNKHRNEMIKMKNTCENLSLLLTHLRKELIGFKKYPRSDLEKETLFHERYLRNLEPDARWRLYHTWVDILRNGLIVELGAKDAQYKEYAFLYEQLRQNDDLQILKTANVVGTTTTLAAKFQPLFTALKPRIVIVEEAAEVLEAHIIASLSQSCEHLILIGDHKQLRPSIAEPRMARQYQLDVSLFERMVLNGMACHTLTLQHRMRPEISKQLVPTIYPILRDDPSVQGKEDIRGMDKNVFFMTHNHFEDEVVEITSKRNKFEAEILLNLAKYLVKQGYKPQDITILATYKGQMYHMKNEIKTMNEFPKGIQITVVDNFQGEENKIILLSLVRSNALNKIGFVGIENRICVALSRAQDGLYMVGNMDCLVAGTEIWAKIKASLIKQHAYGSALPLRCQIHRDQVTMITSARDFSKVSEGGCSLLCGQLLACEHSCKSMCHVEQDYHQLYRCREPCKRILCGEGHPCPRKCHQQCGPCQIPMRRTLPCGHHADVPCHMNVREYVCREPVVVVVPSCSHSVTVSCFTRHNPECNKPCKVRLECGHSCEQQCHVKDDPDHLDYACLKPCARLNKDCSKDHKCHLACFEECQPCSEKVMKELPCGHTLKITCSTDVALILCQQKCIKLLDCGHACRKKCFQQCEPCPVIVEKQVLRCKHKISVACGTLATREVCNGQCPNKLECGHQCNKRCRDTCSSEDCEVPVKFDEKKSFLSRVFSPQSKLLPLLCGHTEAQVPCNKFTLVDKMTPEELMEYCLQPCGKELTCKHVCSGTCSQCMQGRIHKMCNEQCGNVLICGHSCKVPCREVCPPCNEPCRHECKHSKCSKKCGEVCVSCKEPCDYACAHRKCNRRCGELCNIDPCYESCPKIFPCGHSCVGFCGEPCPPCRKCEPHPHFEEIFFTGEETEDDSKWVKLEDCGHTLESSGLEMWLNMEQEGREIACKVCPRCKTPIVKTQRFMNLIKQTYMDIQRVKEQCFGNPAEIKKERLQALRKIQTVNFEQMISLNEPVDELEKLYNELKTELPDVKLKKRNTIDAQKTRLLCFCTEFFISVYKRKQEVWSKLNNEAQDLLTKKINVLTRQLAKRQQKISEQEMQSFERELKRVHRIADLLVYTSSAEYHMANSFSGVKETRKAAENVIFSVAVYDENLDNAMKQLLGKIKEQIRSTAEISDAERAMINEAMSSSFRSASKTGHWFKCKNGHIYCITECGGAMQEAPCPYRGCGERIGGQNHALRADQALAAEMDGARYAAWSDANNMANFGFR